MVKVEVAGLEDAAAGALGDLFEQDRVAAEAEILGRIRDGEPAEGLFAACFIGVAAACSGRSLPGLAAAAMTW